MIDAPKVTLLADVPDSKYDWFNIDSGSVRVGKLRGLIDKECLTIYSITIFPKFQRHGYGEAVVDLFKECFGVIIADSVRPQARGFWEHEGFTSDGRGNYVFEHRLAGDLGREGLRAQEGAANPT